MMLDKGGGAHRHLQGHLRLTAASLTRYNDVEGANESYFKPRQIFNGRRAMKT